LGVSQSKPSTARPMLIATILPGHPRIRLGQAKRKGLHVRLTAPTTARRATLRAYRTDGGTRDLLGTHTQVVHPGTNTVALASAAIRRRITPGSYELEIVLQDAGGKRGAPASTSVRIVR
jgi:hypothetical protein